MSSEIAIKVENLSKCYQIYGQPHDRLKQSIYPRLQQLAGKQPKQYFREFWALNDVSFEIKKGETVGIIGRNGSGKSTLLQMICGTLNLTSGSIQTHGRIAALLELGSGFNPEFTGRENVYLNASVLGLTKREIDSRYEAIVNFADIDDFVDQPVKTYSSGMLVRLAFAVIAHVDADILVVDEALAVGDVFFSQKCMRFFEKFQSAGGTVLLVSHDSAAVVNLCRRAIFLVRGEVREVGPADLVCKSYLEQLYSERTTGVQSVTTVEAPLRFQSKAKADKSYEFSVPAQEPNRIMVSKFNPTAASFGLGGARIVDAGFFDSTGALLTELCSGELAKFSIRLISDKHIIFPAIGLIIKDRLGQAVFSEGTTWAFDGQYGIEALEFFPGDVVRADFDHKVPILFEGEYAVTVAIAEGYGHAHVQHHLIHEALILHVSGRRLLHGITGLPDLSLTIQISRGDWQSESVAVL